MPVRAMNGRDVNCSHGCGFFASVPIKRNEKPKKTLERIQAAWETVELHEQEKHGGANEKLPLDMLRLYLAMPMFGRNYLDQQQVRISCEHRMRRMKELGFEEDDVLYQDQHAQWEAASIAEKSTLRTAYARLSTHPFYEYCEIIKGYGPVACLTYMCYIDPFKANTAGRAKAYFGVIPEAKLVKGERAHYNLEAKGRTYVMMRNIMMQKDPMYYDLYLKKKSALNDKPRSFINKEGEQEDWPPFEEIIEDPTICPKYQGCLGKLERAAKREERKPKKPSCTAHLDNLAKRYVWGIMISHATQIMREALGLDISNFRMHKGYISPKLIKDW